MTHSPGTSQAFARLGGSPQGILAIPLILRDKVAAVLYCDTPRDEVPPATADMIEIMVSFAAKVIDVLSGGARAAASSTSPGTGPRPVMAPPATMTPQPTPSMSDASPTATALWSARPQSTPFRAVPTQQSRIPAPATPQPASRGLPPEEQKAHDDAKRFARLVVSEIKLYNEAKVTEGRRTKDIYERLKEDIERGRQMYHDRVAPTVRDSTDYFYDELVRILAGGDVNALGAM